MKIRTRSARLQDIPHIVNLLTTLVEDYARSADAPLPGPDLPHMYHTLVDPVSHDMVALVVGEEKLLGFAMLAPISYPWFPEYRMATDAIFCVPKTSMPLGVTKALIEHLIGMAHSKNGALILRAPMPFEPADKMAVAAGLGGQKYGGFHLFQAPEVEPPQRRQ